MIKSRLFGSPISGFVKEELEKRQEQSVSTTEFGQSINSDGEKTFDLNERTPFARMWTSVKIITPEQAAETLREITPQEIEDSLNPEEGTIPEVSDVENEFITDDLKIKYPNARVVRIDNKDKTAKFYIKDFGTVREKSEYARKTYIVGGADTNINQPIESLEDSTSDTISNATKLLLPNELQNNKLLKPKAGITSVTSESEGALGVIKKTTVNFIVHNFFDFDKIYNRYFLKPGATIFVDFGWSDVENLYNPIDLINHEGFSDIKQYLYGSRKIPAYEDENTGETIEEQEIDGIVVQNKGKLEVVQGIVTDYSSKVLTNGSVECSLTLTSTNSALLNQQVSEYQKNSIQNTLTNSVLYLALNESLNEDIGSDENTIDSIQLQNNTPNQDTSVESIELFNTRLRELSGKILSSKNFTPSGNSIRTGVYVNSLEADDVYISIGFFEDIIINQQFGFGNNGDEILKGNNLQVRLDSSNSFTTWSNLFLEKQSVMSRVNGASSPLFLIPEWWGAEDPKTDQSSSPSHPSANQTQPNGSYNYQSEKYPKLFYQDSLEHKKIDIEKNRIPIREIFVNIESVISSIKSENSVRKILKNLLGKINDSSNGIFDFIIVTGENDSELRIVDSSRLDITQRIEESGQIIDADGDGIPDFFDKLFTFNVMSPNSIIKDFDLEFKLPSGNIGDMYAIQGMGHENKVFPTTDLVDTAVALSALDDDSLSIIYEPDNGSYRSEQNDGQESKDGEYNDIYQSANYLLSSDIYKTGAIRVEDDLINSQAFLPSSVDDTDDDTEDETDEDKQKRLDNYIQINNRKLITLGYKVANDFEDYFRLRNIQTSLKQRPNLLPYNLSLSTYGISSILPGDTFRVDYLPKSHFKNSYLQCMKVSHAINSDGWYTTLETQYRILSNIKQSHYSQINRDDVFLSPKVIDKLNTGNIVIHKEKKDIHRKVSVNEINDFGLDTILPYITNLKLEQIPLQNIDLVFSFNVAKLNKKLDVVLHHTREPKQSNPFRNPKGHWIRITSDVAKQVKESFNNNEIRAWHLNTRKIPGQRILAQPTYRGRYDNGPLIVGQQTEKRYYGGDFNPNSVCLLPPNINLKEGGTKYYMCVKGENTFFTDNINVVNLFDKQTCKIRYEKQHFIIESEF